MRRVVCYNFRRMVSIRLNWLKALKEGFNVRNGNSLKAFRNRPGGVFTGTGGRRLMEGLFSALFHCPKRMED